MSEKSKNQKESLLLTVAPKNKKFGLSVPRVKYPHEDYSKLITVLSDNSESISKENIEQSVLLNKANLTSPTGTTDTTGITSLTDTTGTTGTTDNSLTSDSFSSNYSQMKNEIINNPLLTPKEKANPPNINDDPQIVKNKESNSAFAAP